MVRVLGIDLGTTNSAMAVLDGESIVVIPNAEGRRTTPSAVFLGEECTLVGESARNQATLHARETITSVKRLIGKRMDSVFDEASLVSYEVISSCDGSAALMVRGKVYSPEEVSSLILRKLKADAEAYLGETIDHAVIAVPAYFDEKQRAATMQAGALAGMDVIQLIDEPNASALIYGLDQKGRTSRVLVFDLGGGTCDVSVLEVSVGTLAVCAMAGDNRLGGDDWDQRVVDWLADAFLKEQGIDLREDPSTLRRVQDAAERAKIDLSEFPSAVISLPFIDANEGGPLHINVQLSREEFEEMTCDLIERCRVLVLDAVQRAGLKLRDIDEVVLVGGSARMPAVAQLLAGMTSRKPQLTVNPDEAVALGAALQGAVKRNGFKGSWLVDATALAPEFRVYAQGVLTTSGWWKEPF